MQILKFILIFLFNLLQYQATFGQNITNTMIKPPSALKYLVRPIENNNGNNDATLCILLHGIGSNKEDLFSFSAYLPKTLFVISAQAPNPYYSGYAWYNLNIFGDQIQSDLVEAKESLQLIHSFIEECKNYYNLKGKVILMGFSQGAIMSYAYAAHYPNQVKEVFAMSGYINQELFPPNFNPKSLANIKYFITHGMLDEVIPEIKAKESANWLQQNELNFEYKTYNMGHGIDQNCFHDILKQLQLTY